MNLCRLLLAVGTAAGLFAGSAAAQTPVVISQVYGGSNATGSVYNRDYVELFNRTGSTVSVAGWSVQYASGSGSVWFKVDLTGSIPAHSYYLVQMTTTGTVGGSLPTPDDTAVTAVNMAAATGKVALVDNGVLITNTGCPTTGGFGVVDFVGYGVQPGTGAGPCFEGSGTTGASLSATVAALRNGGGCDDTNNNAADFTNGTPLARNSATTGPTCVLNQADVSVAASALPNPAYVGLDTLTYTLNVVNSGGGAANNVMVSLPIPAGLGSIASVPAGAVNGSNYEINLGTLAPAANVPVTVTGLPTDETTISATFSVSTSSVESTTANNSATVSVVSLVQAALVPLKVSQIYPGGGGSQVTATYNRDFVEIFNAGAAPVSLNNRSVQYQSATGTTWTRFILPNVSLNPGQYFSIAFSQVGTGGAELPPTDATNTVLSLSATGGKVAIVNGTAFLPTGCNSTGPSMIDLVGYGTGNCSEGLAATWADGDVVNSMVRLAQGCTDTGSNVDDITLNATPVPRGTGSPTHICGASGCNLADITEIGGTSEAPGNPDNQLTVDDIIVFVNLFSDGSGCPAAAPCNRADVTGIGGPPELPDGQLTVDDIIAFFNAFSDGCPA